MKLAWILLAFIALGAAPASAQTGSMLVVPGRSIGQTHLGRKGSFYLNKLPAPTASDAAMMQTTLVWLSPATQDTLSIHTLNNSVLDPPLPGVTINEIRVTSRGFHTRNGLHPGSTLAQIRRRLSALRPDGTGTIYADAAQGIAFEFARHPSAGTRCIAVSVYPSGPGTPLLTTTEVRDVLRSGH